MRIKKIRDIKLTCMANTLKHRLADKLRCTRHNNRFQFPTVGSRDRYVNDYAAHKIFGNELGQVKEMLNIFMSVSCLKDVSFFLEM